MTTIRSAYSTWPVYNSRLRDTVRGMTEEQLAIQPTPERWPLWATVGHLACQRVFWLCDFAGEPGAETTPFTNAGFNCPGDDDLEHVLSPEVLALALDSTFRIIETFLDRWMIDDLEEELRRPEWDGSWVHTRGWVIQRVFTHDVWHAAEVNESLGTPSSRRSTSGSDRYPPVFEIDDRVNLERRVLSARIQRRRDQQTGNDLGHFHLPSRRRDPLPAHAPTLASLIPDSGCEGSPHWRQPSHRRRLDVDELGAR